MSFLRFLMLLSLIVWLGGLIFFHVVAGTSFSVLPTTHLAGTVVRECLIVLHGMGLVSGFVFLGSSLLYNRLSRGAARVFAARHLLVGLMLVLTAISQFGIIPRMDALRASVGEIDAVAVNNPVRVRFNVLHVWSTRVEEGVLLMGLVVVYLTARSPE
jgi:hypothetical protein